MWADCRSIFLTPRVVLDTHTNPDYNTRTVGLTDSAEPTLCSHGGEKMRRTRRLPLVFRLFAALALLAVLVTSACGQQTQTTAKSAEKAPAPAPAAPAPAKSAELRLSDTFPPFTPDPMLLTQTSKPFMDLIHGWLVGETADATISADTGIAERWESSPDFKTWTFYLKKGIKFHNGDEVTAEDVKFSIERVLGPESVSGYAGTLRRLLAGRK